MWLILSNLFINYCYYMCVLLLLRELESENVCTCHGVCGVQRTALGSWVSPSILLEGRVLLVNVLCTPG